MFDLHALFCKVRGLLSALSLLQTEPQPKIQLRSGAQFYDAYNRVHPHSKLGFQSPDQFAMNYPRPEPNIQSGPEMVT